MKSKTKLSVIIFFALINTFFAQNIFVSTSGSDSSAGTIDQPLGTITAAINKIMPGDTIFVRDGVYEYSSNISISKDGTENARYYLFSYPGEQPIIDFSFQTFGSKGINLKADYWYINGFDIKGAGDNGMDISGGSYNIIELCSFYENKDTGLQLGSGASNNRIINCDSYYNADPRITAMPTGLPQS